MCVHRPIITTIQRAIGTPTAARATCAALLVLALAVVPAQAARRSAPPRPLTIAGSPGAGAPPPYIQHFNLFQGYSAQPDAITYSAIYEPLYIFDNGTVQVIPWLASGYKWSNSGKTVTFTIRHGVTWSDGVPMTARDVYYTYGVLTRQLARKSAAGDINGLWTPGSLSEAQSVTMPGPDLVAITFKRVDYTRLTNWNGFFAQSWVLPEHIWSHIKDPFTFPNANPVGTGPFTQVKQFSSTSFDLGKNPYYWQKGKPAIDTIRILGFTSNDAANLAIEAGQVDWTGTLIPHADRVFEARDPQHYHINYATPYANQLIVNCVHYPYSLPALRQALSMAINRQVLDVNGNYGYAPPWDIVGLPRALMQGWRDPGIPDTLAQYNLPAAKALLLKNGFTYKGSQLIDPKGHPVTMEFLPTFNALEGVILSQFFTALSINVNLKQLQFAVYFDLINRGKFDVVDSWGFGLGPTPYHIYAPYFRKSFVYPIGMAIQTGYDPGRWWDPQMEDLFKRFPLMSDPAQQKLLGYQMQRIFVANLPMIPTVGYVIASNYSTLYYTGFPTTEDNYAAAQPIGFDSDSQLILTRLRPVQ